jgi:hypothetical protein
VHQHSRLGNVVKSVITFTVGMVLAGSVTYAVLQLRTSRDPQSFDSDKLIADLTTFDSDRLIEEDVPTDTFAASVNCNCDTKRLKLVKTKTSVDECWRLCKADRNCKSFAVWRKKSLTPEKCALFGKQCEIHADAHLIADGHSTPTACANPTGTKYFNIAYNMRYNLASTNCNCSKTTLKEVKDLVAQGHPTERCWKLTCAKDARCKSFGMWFGKNMKGETTFSCASFDSECPEHANGQVAGTQCPIPVPKPSFNIAFNKLPIQ